MLGDQNTYGLGAVAGDYGSVGTVGTGKGSYEGFNINGQWVFMSNGAGSCGIYNDTNNEWATKWNQNASTDLYYNSSNKFQTTNDGAHCSGALYADHYYVDDYIYHNGDTNSKFGFNATGQIRFETGANERLQIVNNDVRFNYYGRIEVHSGTVAETTLDNGYFVRDIQNGSGIITVWLGYGGTDRTATHIYNYGIGKNVTGGNAVLSVQTMRSVTTNTSDFTGGLEAYAIGGDSVRCTIKSYGTRSGGNVNWRVGFMRLSYN